MEVAVSIACLDCGRGTLLRAKTLRQLAPITPDTWRRFYCRACREDGGDGRNIIVSRVEIGNGTDRAFRSDVQKAGQEAGR